MKHTPGPYKLQGPKTNKDMGDQTYWTIHQDPYKISTPPSKDSVIGFFYPYSGHTAEVQEANANILVSGPALEQRVTELTSGLHTLLVEYISSVKLIAEAIGMKYQENSVVTDTKKLINPNY